MPATVMKKSRQREAILDFLSKRKDHPTADTVYENVRKEYPNISLGTVYRNLTLLSEMGTIQKLTMGSNIPDRFDFNAVPHYHFMCRRCGKVMDLDMDNLESVNVFAGSHFKGTIEGHVAYFFGLCPDCAACDAKEKTTKKKTKSKEEM